MLPLLAANAVTTLADILVSADRISDSDAAARKLAVTGAKAEAGGHAVYTRGQSQGHGTFAQALEKVDTNPLILQALDELHRLAKPDTSLDTLVQASAQPAAAPSSLNATAALHKALQDGGARLHQASRLGINLDAKS